MKSETEQDNNIKKESSKLKRKLPDSEVFDPEAIGHKDVEIISIINMPLWDKAKWKGMVFGGVTGSYLPILAPVFEDKNAGIAIFKEWISLAGKADEKNAINVGLIKGINKNYPHHYKAIFTANTDILRPSNSIKYITVPARYRIMESEKSSIMRKKWRRLKQRLKSCCRNSVTSWKP